MNTTAEARVLASFTFIVALILGAWTSIEGLIQSTNLLPVGPEFQRFVLMLVPIVATAVAVQATRATTVPWAKSVGGAAGMLGVLSSLAALLHFIGRI